MGPTRWSTFQESLGRGDGLLSLSTPSRAALGSVGEALPHAVRAGWLRPVGGLRAVCLLSAFAAQSLCTERIPSVLILRGGCVLEHYRTELANTEPLRSGETQGQVPESVLTDFTHPSTRDGA